MSADSFKYKFTKLNYGVKKFFSGIFGYFLKLVGIKKPAAIQQQIDLDKKLVYSLSKSRIPTLRQLKYLKTYLNKRELWLMRTCSIVLALSLVFAGGRFYFKHLETVPVTGGDYVEGLIGAPKYINPLYASVSDVDSDLTQLIFSSLFKRDANGNLKPDLVESYEPTADGKSYVLKIRSDAKWHSGSNLTVDDVLFTFNAIKDVQYKSPLRNSFSGVEIEKVDDQTVKFSLSEPYAGFPELLTFGIMPQELWFQLPPASAPLAELNLKPVGSGPYRFKSLVKDKSGNIKSINLTVNENYYGSAAHIQELKLKFYPNFEEAGNAINANEVGGLSYLPSQYKTAVGVKTYLNYYKLNLPQLVAVFFNPKNNASLSDVRVRNALAMSIDRQEIVDKILGGDARLIDGPILPDSFAFVAGAKKNEFNQGEALKQLADAGWESREITAADIAKAETDKTSDDAKVKEAAEIIVAMGEGKWYAKGGKFLMVKLTTVDSGANPAVVEAIKQYWQAINVKTIVEIIPPSQIQSDVIKPRDYEALFYGEVMGADPDAYPFWHSSQIGSVGLNLANYSNKEADQLLEKARLTTNQEERKGYYQKFQQFIADDAPAIFMYSPVYTYVQDKTIKNFTIKNIINPSDRLADISDWYIKTGKKIKW